MSTPHLMVAQRTDPGLLREVNEDSYGLLAGPQAGLPPGSGVYIVADGLGGHAAGDVASRLAVETILQACAHTSSWGHPHDLLRDAIEEANNAVYRRARQDAALAEMGTTVVAALILDDMLMLANVGDSRAYLVREGELQQLTRDHSWVAKAVEDGVLTREQARHHPDRNVIYRSLGAASSVDVQTYEYRLQAGDRILLCTDGLTDVVPDALIAELCTTPDVDEAADRLISAANNRGGPDNITATLIAVSSGDAVPNPRRVTPHRMETVRRPSAPPSQGPSAERATRPRTETAAKADPNSKAPPEDATAAGKKRRWWQRRRRG